ncbi:MAG: hypothetical protein K8R87_06765 [Verrucomicrobia bacterium]|nr:hypothetical protein [Verrucomicrobiota bacterium]
MSDSEIQNPSKENPPAFLLPTHKLAGESKEQWLARIVPKVAAAIRGHQAAIASSSDHETQEKPVELPARRSYAGLKDVTGLGSSRAFILPVSSPKQEKPVTPPLPPSATSSEGSEKSNDEPTDHENQ